jgi:hypothetical protein
MRPCVSGSDTGEFPGYNVFIKNKIQRAVLRGTAIVLTLLRAVYKVWKVRLS